jgi:nitric oxide reductase NorE protein
MSSGTEAGKRIPGEAGIWFFILGDMTIFGIFFGTILYYRDQDPKAWDAAQAQLHAGLGLVATILLLTGSLAVVRAVRAARDDGNPGLGRLLLAVAIACAVGFIALKGIEYGDRLGDGVSARSNDFYMCYFTFTGVHLLHVMLGLGVLVWLRGRLRTGVTDDRDRGFLEGGACYWHMVDLLWLVLFPLFYLAT